MHGARFGSNAYYEKDKRKSIAFWRNGIWRRNGGLMRAVPLVIVFLVGALLWFAHGGGRSSERISVGVKGVVAGTNDVIKSPDPPKIAIVTMNTKETSYDHAGYANKYLYARKHNYDLVLDFSMGNRGVWHKLDMVIREIESGKYDWVWWIDFDTLITNFTIKLEDVIEESFVLAESKGLKRDEIQQILTPDCSPLNIGSMLFRSTTTPSTPTPWSSTFLHRTLSFHSEQKALGTTLSDQDCMRDLIAADTLGAKSKTIIVPQKVMNAFPEEIKCYDESGPWKKGWFLLHFAGAWAWVEGENPLGRMFERYEHEVVGLDGME